MDEKTKTEESKSNPVEDLPERAVDSRSEEAVRGGGRKKGSVEHSEFVITKLLDVATPKLYE